MWSVTATKRGNVNLFMNIEGSYITNNGEYYTILEEDDLVTSSLKFSVLVTSCVKWGL